MSTFDRREEGFEKKFAHDEETKFQIRSRRNKLFGLWIGEQLGLSGEANEAYAKELRGYAVQFAGDKELIGKAQADLKAKNLDLSEHRLQRRLAELDEKARVKVTGE